MTSDCSLWTFTILLACLARDYVGAHHYDRYNSGDLRDGVYPSLVALNQYALDDYSVKPVYRQMDVTGITNPQYTASNTLGQMFGGMGHAGNTAVHGVGDIGIATGINGRLFGRANVYSDGYNVIYGRPLFNGFGGVYELGQIPLPAGSYRNGFAYDGEGFNADGRQDNGDYFGTNYQDAKQSNYGVNDAKVAGVNNEMYIKKVFGSVNPPFPSVGVGHQYPGLHHGLV